jgi:hypothetical protein
MPRPNRIEHDMIDVVMMQPFLATFEDYLDSRGLMLAGPIPSDDPEAPPAYVISPTQETWDRFKPQAG